MTDLTAAATAAVAAMLADNPHSSLMVAMETVRIQYATSPRPSFTTILCAVEDAYEKQTGRSYPAFVA